MPINDMLSILDASKPMKKFLKTKNPFLNLEI